MLTGPEVTASPAFTVTAPLPESITEAVPASATPKAPSPVKTPGPLWVNMPAAPAAHASPATGPTIRVLLSKKWTKAPAPVDWAAKLATGKGAGRGWRGAVVP